MQISLFIYKGERNRVNKADFITGRFNLNGTIKKPTSAFDVVIEIEKTNPVSMHYNYMYISEFDRWYFITDIENIHNNIWVIHGHVDVLYTYRADILKAHAIIDKSEVEGNANLYLDDGSFVMDSRKYNEIKAFSTGFDDNGSYILICAGG